MKYLAAAFAAMFLMGCTSTKVVVVTTVVKTTKMESSDGDYEYYEGPMDTKSVKNLLNDTLDQAYHEKPEDKD